MTVTTYKGMGDLTSSLDELFGGFNSSTLTWVVIGGIGLLIALREISGPTRRRR
jgi:hypothetical protein